MGKKHSCPNNVPANKTDENAEIIRKEYQKSIDAILTKNYLKNSNWNKNKSWSIIFNKPKINWNSSWNQSVFAFSLKHRDLDSVYWCDYLYDFLNGWCKERIEWADELLYILDDECFISEVKFQSWFFFQEFIIKTTPKPLMTLMNDDKKTTLERHLFYSDGMTNINTNNKSVSKTHLNISNNYGGSFTSYHDDNWCSNDPLVEYSKSRGKVKEYIKIFKAHLSEEDHPIHIVIKKFVKVISKYIDKKNGFIIWLDNALEKEKIRVDIIKNIQKFIMHWEISCKLFYWKAIDFSCFQGEKAELINLITGNIFNTGCFYDKWYALYSNSMRNDIDNFSQKLRRLSGLKPQDLKIKTQFCWNDITWTYQEKMLKALNMSETTRRGWVKVNKWKNIYSAWMGESQKNNSQHNNDNDDDHDEEESSINTIPDNNRHCTSHCPPLISNSLVVKSNWVEDMNEDDFHFNDNIKINNLPSFHSKVLKNTTNNNNNNDCTFHVFQLFEYNSAVSILKSISKYETPFEKMLIIGSLSDQITQSIDSFWSGITVDTSWWNLDSDDLMQIFKYIVIKSQLNEIWIQIRFIKDFITTTTKATMLGYYYTVLEAAIKYIEDSNE